MQRGMADLAAQRCFWCDPVTQWVRRCLSHSFANPSWASQETQVHLGTREVGWPVSLKKRASLGWPVSFGAGFGEHPF